MLDSITAGVKYIPERGWVEDAQNHRDRRLLLYSTSSFWQGTPGSLPTSDILDRSKFKLYKSLQNFHVIYKARKILGNYKAYTWISSGTLATNNT